MNPFKMRPERTGDLFVDWEKFWVKPYNKNEVNPYTRTRIILMNGTEFENVWFSHQFSRSVGNVNKLQKRGCDNLFFVYITHEMSYNDYI